MRGLPIYIWNVHHAPFLVRVATLLNVVEESGEWPQEVLAAYVTMIPKSSGGTRPQDQRPITVLDVLYRVWAKGVVLNWAPVLQREYPGLAAMGFRAQSGTLHLAQLLSDLIELQRRRKQQLWLVSFDVEKCFPSLPWWAIFGVLTRAGVPQRIVRCFRQLYANLRHRFRFGQVDGTEWSMTNGLAQGCPASPDLLNVLFEPFHRWAASQSVGVPVLDTHVASTSFADDLVLLGTDLRELVLLVDAYHSWCRLLGVTLHLGKTQLWSLQARAGERVVLPLTSGPLELEVRATFRVVGVELGATERVATAVHFAQRLSKALLSGRRLTGLDVPAPLAAHLWRTAVLPQALYGCELRRLTPSQLCPLAVQCRRMVARKAPLALSHYAASEVLHGPPLGACAVVDPRREVLVRRLKWLAVIANMPGLVGAVHRLLATTPGPSWREHSGALAAALAEVQWSVSRNLASPRGCRWPLVEPELSFRGEVFLEP